MTPDMAVANDALTIDVIRRQLATRTIGRRIVLHDVVASTNATLRELADAGALEGTVVLAERQTAGKGRERKPWFSPGGVNLYASVLLRPSIKAIAASTFTFIASLALTDAIHELGLKAAVKWPNDVLVERRKVAGVRAQLATRGSVVDYIVLGVGVNLNVTRAALKAGLGEMAQAATSLGEVLGERVDRNAFTARFLTHLENRLNTYRTKGARSILARWRDLDVVTGHRVEIQEGPKILVGRALGVNAAGQLRVKDFHKRIHTVTAGAVRLIHDPAGVARDTSSSARPVFTRPAGQLPRGGSPRRKVRSAQR
jgi:BirA family biotin operon repressor/biotin-[acetyl-CoA-carboxylase] ligase